MVIFVHLFRALTIQEKNKEKKEKGGITEFIRYFCLYGL